MTFVVKTVLADDQCIELFYFLRALDKDLLLGTKMVLYTHLEFKPAFINLSRFKPA